jgi:FixJ family two-component response regulator
MGFMVTGSPLGHHIGSAPEVGQSFSSKLSQSTPVIFIVDPDRAVRESLERLMRCEGWHSETFASAEEFLAHPLEVAPGCLTLDVSLPGLSGLELQKRAAVECPHIPTIFLTANDDIPTTVEAMKAGAVEFLTKPFRDNEFLRAVREALERSRLVIAKNAQKQALQGCYASLCPRTAGYDVAVLRVDQQAGRRATRHQRNHGESAPRPSDAEDACRLFRRSGENGREARSSQAPRSDDGLRSCRSCSSPRRSTPWKLRIRALAEYRIARWSVMWSRFHRHFEV